MIAVSVNPFHMLYYLGHGVNLIDATSMHEVPEAFFHVPYLESLLMLRLEGVDMFSHCIK
jgi:hypothetical protein